MAIAETKFEAEEFFPFRPTMRAEALRRLVHSECDWLLEREPDAAFFWYYPVEAPYEPRRGLRGPAPEHEHESAMDLPRGVHALAAELDTCAPGEAAAELVARRPELRAVTRVQAGEGLGYAELRQNYLAADFTPFAGCRLLLAFYGMEKYDPRPPRSTKGALLQGAPLPDEIEEGIDGDWPFPLIPDLPATPGAIVPLRALERPEAPVSAIQALGQKDGHRIVHRDPTHIFPLELRKLLTNAFQTQGCSLGVAEALAWMVQDMAILGLAGLDAVLACLAEATLAALPSAVDLACVRGAVRVEAVRPSALLGAAALRAARQGFYCGHPRPVRYGRPAPAPIWLWTRQASMQARSSAGAPRSRAPARPDGIDRRSATRWLGPTARVSRYRPPRSSG